MVFIITFFCVCKNNLEMPLDELLAVDKSIFQGGRRVSVAGTGVRPLACGQAKISLNFSARCFLVPPRLPCSLAFMLHSFSPFISLSNVVSLTF